MPNGFEVQFHTDGASYMFSLEDRLDPCGYVLFSDQERRVYETTALRRPTFVALTQ